MARTLELDTITEPSNSGTANITLSSDTTTTMPLVDINGGAIDGTTVGVASPSSVAATTLTASGATTLNGDVTLGNASADTITVTGTMAGIDNKSGMTGEIRMWGGTSAPTGWLLCDGASIARVGDYAALYAIIGTNFGTVDGDTFNVPDMKGRMPVGVGTGAGGGAEAATGGTVPVGGSDLTARSLGEWTGAEVLSTAQMAAHTHTLTSGAPSDNTSDGTAPSTNSQSGGTTTNAPNVTNTLGQSASHQHTAYVEGGTSGVAVNAGTGGMGTGEATGTHYAHRGSDNNYGHTHSMASHWHSITGHTHGTASHTHTMKNHTHSGTTNSGTGTASKFTTPIMCVNFIIKT